MKILYWCCWGQLTGYGKAAADYAMALLRAGVDVTIEPVAGIDPAWRELEPRFHPLEDHVGTIVDPTTYDLELFHAPPATLERIMKEMLGEPRRRIAYTTWESRPLPARFVDFFNGSFAGVLVPSTFCKAIFVDAGVRTVHVLPHTFDVQHFVEPLQRPDPEGIFTFLSVGTWCARKNPLGILSSYLNQFSRSDRVRLVMIAQDADLAAAQSLIARSGIPADELPGLLIPEPGRRLSDQELREVYRQANVFVSASRGEGWDLPCFEARAMGKPVIAPSIGGQADYLHRMWRESGTMGEGPGLSRSLTYDIPCASEPCFAEERDRFIDANGRVTSRIIAPPGMTAKQCWAAPNLGHLSRLLREALEDGRSISPELQAKVRRKTHEEMSSHYGYDRIGPMLVNLCKEISA